MHSRSCERSPRARSVSRAAELRLVARLRRWGYETSRYDDYEITMSRKQWTFPRLCDVTWMMLLRKLLFCTHFGLVFHVVICFKDTVGKFDLITGLLQTVRLELSLRCHSASAVLFCFQSSFWVQLFLFILLIFLIFLFYSY